MNKTSIKIIKRKDVEASAANVETQNVREPELTAVFGTEKFEHLLHRKMADTVSNWISERRETSRAEEISAIRRIFGSESLFGKAA